MTNLSVIENKISSIKKYLKITERYKKHSREEIENNIDIKGAVERYLYLAAQATIDLAEAVIAYKNFRKPTTMSEAFHILEENKITLDGQHTSCRWFNISDKKLHPYLKERINSLCDKYDL